VKCQECGSNDIEFIDYDILGWGCYSCGFFEEGGK